MKKQDRLKLAGPGEIPLEQEVPMLIAALRTSHSWLDASIRLGEIGEPAVAALLEGLNDPVIDSFAFDALTRIGKPAIPFIVTMYETNKANRDWAVLALNFIIGKKETKKVLNNLTKPDPAL